MNNILKGILKQVIQRPYIWDPQDGSFIWIYFSNQKYASKGFSDILIKTFEEIYLKVQQNTEIGSIIMLC